MSDHPVVVFEAAPQCARRPAGSYTRLMGTSKPSEFE